MSYEEEVIDAARKGYGESMTKWTPELEKLLRVIYKAGYNSGKYDAMMLDRIRAGAEQQMD